MKIILQPTNNKKFEVASSAVLSAEKQWGVVIEHPDDDMCLNDVVALVSRALVAYGFSKENVQEYFEELQDA